MFTQTQIDKEKRNRQFYQTVIKSQHCLKSFVWHSALQQANVNEWQTNKDKERETDKLSNTGESQKLVLFVGSKYQPL